MVEKNDCKNLLVSASVIIGTLAVSTIATGLYLVSIKYISQDHFFAGLAAGCLGTSTLLSVGYCATRQGFFCKKENEAKENEHQNLNFIKNIP